MSQYYNSDDCLSKGSAGKMKQGEYNSLLNYDHVVHAHPKSKKLNTKNNQKDNSGLTQRNFSGWKEDHYPEANRVSENLVQAALYFSNNLLIPEEEDVSDWEDPEYIQRLIQKCKHEYNQKYPSDWGEDEDGEVKSIADLREKRD